MSRKPLIVHSFKRQSIRPIERIALEIGYITIYWAWLEDAVDSLIDELVPLDSGQVAEAITGNVDIRHKVQMVKALAFLRKGPAVDWYESVVETLNTIDNDLRARRNTYTHSAWYTAKGRLTRHKKSVKLSKSQSFQPIQLQTIEKVPVKISEARKLKKEIIRALRNIAFQTAFAMNSAECALSGISYAQFLRVVAPPAYQIRIQAKPKRQPRRSHS